MKCIVCLFSNTRVNSNIPCVFALSLHDFMAYEKFPWNLNLKLEYSEICIFELWRVPVVFSYFCLCSCSAVSQVIISHTAITGLYIYESVSIFKFFYNNLIRPAMTLRCIKIFSRSRPKGPLTPILILA